MAYKRNSPQPVIEGGTGVQTNTTYAVLCGGTTTTNSIQSIASVGTSGQVLTSNGAGALPTFQAGGGGGITSVTGDTGGAQSGPAITLIAGTGSTGSGSSVSFSGSANTIKLNLSDIDANTILGYQAGNASISGTNNTAIGSSSLEDLTSGSYNTVIGDDAGGDLHSGSNNVLIGYKAGFAYSSSESSNICIGYEAEGSTSESNVLRIGSATGTSAGQLNKTYICGIDGINVGSTANIVTESSNQLGTAVLTAGTGITITPGANTITIAATGGGGGASAFATDSGTATESGGTINVIANTATLNCGSTVSFTGSGDTVQLNVTDSNNNSIIGLGAGNASIAGTGNTGFGAGSLASLATTSGNVAIGYQTLGSATSPFGPSNDTAVGYQALQNDQLGSNTAVGYQAMQFGTNMAGNVAIGYQSMQNITSGNNVAIGEQAMWNCTAVQRNIAIGGSTLENDGGGFNVAIGHQAGQNITSGSNNIFIGVAAATGYTSSETSNIVIGDNGQAPAGQSNTLFIGAGTGTSTSQLNQAFISGIYGITPSSADGIPVFIGSGGQLGTVGTFPSFISTITADSSVVVGPASGNLNIVGDGVTVTATGNPGTNTITLTSFAGGTAGLVSIAGDDASAQTGPAILLEATPTAGSSVSFTGSANTISLNVTDTNNSTIIGKSSGNSSPGSCQTVIGGASGTSLNNGGESNTIMGANCAQSLTNGSGNVIIGYNSAASMLGANNNVTIGQTSGNAIVYGSGNTCIGFDAGYSFEGSSNTLIGYGSGDNFLTGQRNTIIGYNAGSTYNGAESDNIVINDNATSPAGTSNTLTIGAGTGTGDYQLNQVFISGIQGITVTGAAVLVSSSDQLGVAVSSKRFKHDIQDMNDESSSILDLRPVTFVYNGDVAAKKQYGLIAEEVNEIFPDLVSKNKDGDIETVMYHVLPSLLLNEIKKLVARIAALEAKL